MSKASEIAKVDGRLTIEAPLSTYKFSKLISIHSLKELVERIWEKIKAFFSDDHFINSHNLISWQSMDIVGRKLMLVAIGTIKA